MLDDTYNELGAAERVTQNKVVALFRDHLQFTYLGNWKVSPENARTSPIEESLLRSWLERRGGESAVYAPKIIQTLKRAASNPSCSLYETNKAVYSLLYYGVGIAREVGQSHTTFPLIDWDHPENNDFAVAEEVSVRRVDGKTTRRPDVVLYVNGIALAVLELKRGSVTVNEAIRQNQTNQYKDEIPHFFSTVQLVMAANETEGLRYATTKTPPKYYLTWKRDQEDTPVNHLLEHLRELCSQKRLLEFIHDFVVYDAGIKKVARPHQYRGIKKAQEYLRRREGGIIWHTQGSGKSLLMIWLAKWILRNTPHSRVLVITDRTELDEQIDRNFNQAGITSYRTKSSRDLFAKLNRAEERVICSLVHKFGLREGDADDIIREWDDTIPADFRVKGDLHVFIDECHRTQSGKLAKAMKRLLGSGIFIGFTGTPLFKSDKETSRETFGNFIDTYKFDEAVRDGAVLDLRYEARNVDQDFSPKGDVKLDERFERLTTGMTDEQKYQLKQKWGTMKALYSSRERLERIAANICEDMDRDLRLRMDAGNAMLVADNIYQAFRFYEIFQRTELKGKCAVVSSYVASSEATRTAGLGAAQQSEEMLKYETCQLMLKDFGFQTASVAACEKFESKVKEMFIKEPGQMKLLIVVDKLLTGFDAPPATYLYIDKKMQDHGLFQAICRVNRLDGESKEFGYIVDYKDLFRSLEKAVKSFTAEAFEHYELADVQGLLKDRLTEANKLLTQRLDRLRALCEPVAEPKGQDEYLAYFCMGENLEKHQRQRVELYTGTAALMRAYAKVCDELDLAGYSKEQITLIREEVEHFANARDAVKLASGDYIDMKMYEAEMRNLIDTYVHASDAESVSTMEDMGMVELLVTRTEEIIRETEKKTGKHAAESIGNNLKKEITEKRSLNPKFYDSMGTLLIRLLEDHKKGAIEYKDFLEKVVDLAKKIKDGERPRPKPINTPRLKALYDNAPVPRRHAERFPEQFALVMNRKCAGMQAGFQDPVSTRYREAFLLIREGMEELRDEFDLDINEEMIETVFNLAVQHYGRS